ncbi:MAG: LptF/LptG family permease [Pirellulales bacterium]
MRLLTRYVLGELGLVFSITLVSLTVMMVMIGAVREAIAQGLGIVQILQLLPYLMPNALMFAVPGTILFAVSSVYGRMSGANEVVALKSLGISPMVILWPALIVAVLLSFATLWLNDLAMSWGQNGMRRVVIDGLEDIAYGTLRARKSFSTNTFSVTVQRVEGRKLIMPMFMMQEDGRQAQVRAEWAELRSNPGSGILTVKLYNASVHADGQHFEQPGELEREIPVNPGLGGDPSPAHMALAEIPKAKVRQLETIETINNRMVARAGFQMLTGDVDALTSGSWQADAKDLEHQMFRLFRMHTEPPRRWANGFSCLCFALVGSAMAIRRRNADALTSFFLCFGPILIVYYPLLAFGVDRAKAGAVTPYAVWLANVILAAWGLWLLRRVVRY